MTDLTFASALEQARLVRDREVSSRELVDHYLTRIEQHDEELNSYVHVFADDAREAAASKDVQTAAGGDLPPFHGVPVSIKELSFLIGKPATLATRSLKDFVAPFDDHAIAVLKQAGVVPLGKTNSPELGSTAVSESELFGPARNPWDPGRTPGGSSGGAAAALAAGLCPVSQGSDGAGSIRIPASCCGVFGLKPSRHRISNAPLFASDMGLALTTKGMLTRTVADSAAFLDLLAGYTPGDPVRMAPPERPFAEDVGRDPGSLTVGILGENPMGHLSPEVRDAIATARAAVEEVGHHTVEISLEIPDDVVEAFEDLWGAMVSAQPFPIDTLEPYNRWLADRGRDVSGGALLMAEWRVQLFCRDLVQRLHGEFDLLLAPVLAELPLEVGFHDRHEPEEAWEKLKVYVAGLTPLVNAAGLPAASIPLHWDEASGMPVGVQLVGRMADEATILAVSAQLEQARPWADRRPPGFD